MKNILFLLLFNILSFISLKSQPSCTFTQYTTNDGLIQKTISYILQDHKGFIWVSTWDGINRFDGYTFKNYKARPGDLMGFINNRVDYIAEDYKGFIWALSYDGHVYRFDPRTESFFPLPYNDYQARNIYISPTGHIWITTEKALLLVTYQDDDSHIVIENFSVDNQIQSDEKINQIYADREKNEWILTDNGIYLTTSGLKCVIPFFVEEYPQNSSFYKVTETEDYLFFSSGKGSLWRYNKQTKEFTLIKLPVDSSVTCLQILGNKELVCGTNNDGFFIVNINNGKSRQYKTTICPQLPSNCIKSIYVSRNHEVWIQHDKDGITLFHPQSEKINYFNPVSGKDKSEANSELFIAEDKSGNLWVHPPKGELFYYDRPADQLISFSNPAFPSEKQRIANRITALFMDRQENMWIGSYDNGLEKVTFNDTFFKFYTDPTRYERTGQNNARALLYDNQNRLWIACKDKTIAIYDNNHNFLGYLHLDGSISAQPDISLGMAYTITQDTSGTIWIGTKGNGLIEVRSGTTSPLCFRLKQYKYSAENIYSLSHNDIYAVCEDAVGRIWIATFGGGVNYVEQAEGRTRFINYRNGLKKFPIPLCYRTRDLVSDGNGRIWIATSNGLLACKEEFSDPEQLEFEHYIRTPEDINSLSNNNINRVFLTHEKELYVLTFGGGLNKLVSLKDGKAHFNIYTTLDHLPSDLLVTLVEDKNGNLWIAMEEELCKFNPSTKTVENYPAHSFPQSLKFNEGRAVCLPENGSLLFNTKQGVLYFKPDSINKSTYVPSIVFTGLQLSNKIITPGDSTKLLQLDIDDTRLLTFTHDNNSFSIQFAALDMKYPGNISYAYRLKGFEKEWNEVGKQRTATYTNVPRGNYEFQVCSTNSDGSWVDNIRRIDITVLPSFWETPWAIFLYILAVMCIIWIAVYILFTFYRLKHEVSVEQKLSELKLQFFTNISHELRTPLTLIVGPVEQLLEDKNISSYYRTQLNLVERNANRMRQLVNQILDLRKIQNNKMKMRVQQIELISFIRRLMESFNILADEHHIDFKLEKSVDPLYIWVDMDKLEKILFNLLSNAFKYTPQGKQIKIIIHVVRENVSICIEDQGIGISEDKQKRLFERFENLVDKNLFNRESTGIGLSLVKELVEMHKGTIGIESWVGKGSKFTILLPLGKEHFDPNTEFILTDIIENEVVGDKVTAGSLISENENIFSQSVVFDSAKETLLLVEDNWELRYFLKTIFSPYFNIVEAADGVVGFNMAKEVVPDIIISDVMMPGKDGIQMMRELREEMSTSHIPLVLLTAKSTVENKIEGMESGADDYITKPFSAAYLKARIFNLLAQRKKLQALYCATLLKTSAESSEEDKKEDIAPVLSANDKLFMDRLIRFIEDNLDNGNLMIADLTQELGMSRSVFFNKLKTLTGLSPVEFLREMRIKKAAQLILADESNMAQIAYQVGFNDSHYFSKCFKQVYGVTPTEYKSGKENRI